MSDLNFDYVTRIYWIFIFCVFSSGHEIGVDRINSIPEESYVIDRSKCSQNTVTSKRLAEVRNLFDKYNVEAYIITSDDVHMHPGSSSISAHDKRLGAVSGFSKNFGIGVVTRNEAALWTDGRKFRLAMEETDCGWELHRKGATNGTTVTRWITDKLNKLDGHIQVGSDPRYMNAVWWKNFDVILSESNIKLLAIDKDLVDQIWTDRRPIFPSTDINAIDIKYTGRTWQDKVEDVRKEMNKKNVDALVVTGVDEIAWLFNIRGKDFLFKPFFYSFALVEKDTTSLYIIDSRSKLSRPPTDPETKLKLKAHLKTEADGKCKGQCVQVKEYDHDTFVQHVTAVAQKQDGRNVWVSFECNFRIYSSIPENKIYQAIPPTLYLRSKKNFVERNGMRKSNDTVTYINASIKSKIKYASTNSISRDTDTDLLDSVEIIEFFARLEKEIQTGVNWTVHDAAEEAIKVRSRSLSLYRDQSFNTLSGSGHRGADFNYSPTKETDHVITTTEIFNQDSGGHYLDGTSDVTRTFHYGKPTEHEKEMYTRVLMAHINLSKLKFPSGATGREIDIVSREPLWEIGADYAHETGHGISHNGAVVEGPARISSVEETHTSDVALHASLFEEGNRKLEMVPDWNDYPIEEHMCFTTEPGFYEPGHYGIRTENVMIVRKVEHQNNKSACGFLEFETVTLIPYEPHLIDLDLLSKSQVDWMNSYHKTVWNNVSPFLKRANNNVALDWLYKRVQPVHLHHTIHSYFNENYSYDGNN